MILKQLCHPSTLTLGVKSWEILKTDPMGKTGSKLPSVPFIQNNLY